MRWFVFGLFLLSAHNGEAQYHFGFELWCEGSVVFENGDTVKGNLMYNLEKELVQFDNKVKLESYSARKIVYFEVFDGTIKRYRKFYALPYSVTGNYSIPAFFELLTEGKLILLCREQVENRSRSSTIYYHRSNSRMVIVNKFFLWKGVGEIAPFLGNKNDLIQILGSQGEQVNKYIKANKLDIDDKYDFAKTIEYYNSLL